MPPCAEHSAEHWNGSYPKTQFIQIALRDTPKPLLRFQSPRASEQWEHSDNRIPEDRLGWFPRISPPLPFPSQAPTKAELEVGLRDLHHESHPLPFCSKGMKTRKVQTCSRSQSGAEVGLGLDPRKIHPILWGETGEQWWVTPEFSQETLVTAQDPHWSGKWKEPEAQNSDGPRKGDDGHTAGKL